MYYLLQHLLISSAKQYPDKIALTYEGVSMSYSELDTLTNQLAHMLQEQGVQRGDRVGIYINKSIPSIVSIYAILKSGAVYVPLDPQAPPSRISYIIDNCEIKCLLTSTEKIKVARIVASLASSLQQIVLTDNKHEIAETSENIHQWRSIEAYKSDLPDNKSISDDLAYIIYTSGSTGNPKGVMISHSNSLTFVNWAATYLSIKSDDVFSSHAPLHFDLSIFDIFVTAKVGGTVVLVPETMSVFPSRLSSWIEKNKISVWYSVPSILSMMVTHGQLELRDFSSLRKVIFAGEVFPVKYLRRLMEVIGKAEFVNLYGPTETNVITYHVVSSSIPENQTKPMPIGKSCESMEVFALTSSGKLVIQPGQEGELMARGTCVAQGYWGDEKKTEEVFSDNPLQRFFKDRMYRTGDLVILGEDGTYEYKGRLDHMFKSRGYRIEIGEIESVIYGHSAIKEAAVIAIPDDLITNRIMAIIVTTEDVNLTALELRSFCSEKLPKYMVPETIEFKDCLPKTSTGKIDKTLLLKTATGEPGN